MTRGVRLYIVGTVEIVTFSRVWAVYPGDPTPPPPKFDNSATNACSGGSI